MTEYGVAVDTIFWEEADDPDEAKRAVREKLGQSGIGGLDLRVVDSEE